MDHYGDQVDSLNLELNDVRKAIASDGEPAASEALKNVTFNAIKSIISSELSNFQREILSAVDKRLANMPSPNRAQSRPRSLSRQDTLNSGATNLNAVARNQNAVANIYNINTKAAKKLTFKQWFLNGSHTNVDKKRLKQSKQPKDKLTF